MDLEHWDPRYLQAWEWADMQDLAMLDLVRQAWKTSESGSA